MPRSRKSQRAKRKKEPRISMKNGYDKLDLTPYNAVCLIRGEPEKIKI